jgi:hypothetical protein
VGSYPRHFGEAREFQTTPSGRMLISLLLDRTNHNILRQSPTNWMHHTHLSHTFQFFCPSCLQQNLPYSIPTYLPSSKHHVHGYQLTGATPSIAPSSVHTRQPWLSAKLSVGWTNLKMERVKRMRLVAFTRWIFMQREVPGQQPEPKPHFDAHHILVRLAGRE